LQETKISDRVADFAIEILGTTFQYDFVPSVGASGGILLAWSSPAWEVSNVWKGHFSLSVQLTRPGSADFTWWLTTVYGPQPDIDKAQFLDELREFRAVAGGPWLLCGDFNMIYRAQDKNNDRLDRRCMRRFRRFLSELLLEEIEIQGRRFTWSSETTEPTLVLLDRFFASDGWFALFQNHVVAPLSTDCSDHCPLLLQVVAPSIFK